MNAVQQPLQKFMPYDWHKATLWLFCMAQPLLAVEPLQWPQLGYEQWNHENSSQSNGKTTGFFGLANVPVPVTTPIGMPFLTTEFRELDQETPSSTTVSIDQRVGVGMLHYAPEGEPAWRFDAKRIGPSDEVPLWHYRLQMNAFKFWPSLRPLPTDRLRSWIAMNAWLNPDRSARLAPEFVWQRISRGGMLVELSVPSSIKVGFQQNSYHVLMGAERIQEIWSSRHEHRKNANGYQSIVRNQLRFETGLRLLGGISATIALLKDSSNTDPSRKHGIIASMLWEAESS